MFIFFKNKSLAARMVFYILLCSSCVTLCITSIQLYIEYKRDLSDLERKFAEIHSGYNNTITHGLWVFDKQQLQLQLEGIAHIPDIDYVEVTSITDHRYVYGTFPDISSMKKSWPILHDNDVIGSFTIVANLTYLYNRIIDQAITILITQFIKSLVVSALIFYIFYMIVSRHLSQLSAYAQEISLDTLVQQIINSSPPVPGYFSK